MLVDVVSQVRGGCMPLISSVFEIGKVVSTSLSEFSRPFKGAYSMQSQAECTSEDSIKKYVFQFGPTPV